jgi:Holliday junction resolvasome RuvABC DNA-binding subunit
VDEDLGVTAEATSVPTEDSMRADALSALLNLGYQRNAAEKAVTAALGENDEVSVESILRASLRKLAKG